MRPELRAVLDPFFSIVIPAYNESARLGATLERVLAFVNQQGWDAEVIVVDDGSTDNTAAIARSYAQNTNNYAQNTNNNDVLRVIENP